MIIQIRGTSGSGKSTAMRRWMETAGPWEGQLVDGRKKPLFYSNAKDVVVLGHYDSQCGGCDTIGSAAAVNELIGKVAGGTFHGNERKIVCEGLLLSEDTKWSSQMDDLRVIYLTTPLDRCLRQIESRREEKGKATKPLNVDNTTRRFAVIERSRVKLMELGVPCVRCSVEQVPGVINKWLAE